MTALLFAMQGAQWRLGSISVNDPRSRKSVLVGVASYVLAMVMFGCLLALSALFPAGAAIVVVALIVIAFYLSTWD